ncbi:YegS/Rv2252/BmrU family lipid kinase [Stappia sp. BW2]|uniref:diacylglycerol/lipid kinase family protein n=1 Tax=Stappia sp. BW2 TaxID=2592622 RepID=UPI001AD9225C|nr:YegS/Rv2252/BmrU family lipid kinase [Stappia sp. BW2]
MRLFGWSGAAAVRTMVPDMAGKVLIIANPTSGGYNAELLDDVRNRLEDLGCKTEIRLTRRAGEIGDICSDPSLPVQTLVVAGGDGSVNEALTGFQNHPAPPQLGIIPFGTANVLALELGLPRTAKAIAALIRRGKTRQLHYGLANGRPFVLMASAGFDAEVVHAVPLSLKRRLGKLAYVITALRTGFKRKSASLKVVLDGEELTGKLAVASNARHYGGPFIICPGGATDPGLHMLVLERDDPWSSFCYGVALLMGRIHKAKGALVRPFTSASILATGAVAAQVDGDPFGATPLEIRQTDKTVPILAP